MLEKIKCGEGEHCLRCKFYKLMEKAGISASFTKNQLGRCDWFAEKKKS